MTWHPEMNLSWDYVQLMITPWTSHWSCDQTRQLIFQSLVMWPGETADFSGSAQQGWKLLTVHLSGTDKNYGGQVNILGTFPKKRLKFCLFPLVVNLTQLRTGKNNDNFSKIMITFPHERQKFSVISIPVLMWPGLNVLRLTDIKECTTFTNHKLYMLYK